MDPLFAKAQELFPGASQQEIQQGIEQVRSQAPNASDDEILQVAQKMKAAKDDGSFMKQMVNHDVQQKYGLGARQKIVDQNAEEASGPNWRAGLAAIGAGLQGQNAGAAAAQIMDQQSKQRQGRLAEFDKQKAQSMADRDDEVMQAKLGRETDPNSAESKMAQDLAVAMGMNAAQAKGLTAAKFKEFSPALQKKYEIAEKSLDRSERAADRRESRDARLYQQSLAREDKKEKEAKLSDKQIESFTDFDNAQSDLNNILAQLGEHSDWTGPADGRIPSILVGQDQNAWRSAVGKYKDAYRKAVTGAGASNAEIARLESRLPSETDTFETFKSKAAEAQNELARRKEVLASNLQKGGKNVEKFKNTKTAMQMPSSDTVRMRDPRGNIRLVPKNQVAAAQKAGGTVVDESVAQKDEEADNGV
ncbi:MAG: hypothetical protein HC838_00180 [Spirulinaceae cyanobacterium RM2_2_10]|nr:hypothetical protein [Spirulinaceae cyanobacterium RM2_2_10]